MANISAVANNSLRVSFLRGAWGALGKGLIFIRDCLFSKAAL